MLRGVCSEITSGILEKIVKFCQWASEFKKNPLMDCATYHLMLFPRMYSQKA